MKPGILEKMAQTPLIFDGAMGTMIYAKGVFLNVCYDELCLTNPKLIQGIHREYAEAGADVLETNTFGANRIKLKEFGLADKVEAINRAGVRVAREAAGSDLYVAGSVGPCLKLGQILSAEHEKEIVAAFNEQMQALVAEGVDLIMLETFCDLHEMRLAAEVARRLGTPVFASFTFNDTHKTALGTPVEQIVAALNEDANVDVIGINCGVGPAPTYDALERALPLARKPFLVMPNAGMPRMVEGRMLYLSSPEYFTEYCKKFIELGVRAVGGCCGTTPAHIRMAARSVKTMSGVKKHAEIKAYAPSAAAGAEVKVIPPERRSRFASLLLSGRKVTTVELLPPKSSDMTGLIERARECYLAGVDAINIPDGPRASARVSPMITAIAIRERVGIEPILHYCCRDRNLIGMQSDLLGGYAAGLANFLIITGDPPKLGDYPDATGVFDVDAIGLTQVAANLNNGRDIGGNPITPPTGLFIGVGANPCAVEPQRELTRYFAKIEAGAQFAITQPVFDPEALFRFLDAVEKHARRIPVVAGVWPLISYKNAEFMKNEVPGVEIPDSILERMSHCARKEDGIKMGIEISREICERIAPRVAGYQVSAPFGHVEIALKVLE
ncbi:MAG: bifunctional homocysteine S-methyltransferase/methylenetetrahydrofolate reductase [Candidatus Sumerlaeota bacterium]|nr:bifunctional homocysteine S-methyltransferase/methylenetetrahydrofolate reductase [Candidatus Sumerlaeota bacterium]